MMITRDKDGDAKNQGDLHGSRGECDICGKPSDAYWFGAVHDTAICRTCATDILPRLIVDALSAPYGGDPGRHMEKFLLEIQASFWKGATATMRSGFQKRIQELS